MKLQKVYQKICVEWSNIDFTLKSVNDNELNCNASITAEDYFDDEVFIEIVVYKSGTVHVFCTFDTIKRTPEAYELINDFNEHTPFGKAYITEINDNEFLQLHYAYYSSKNEAEATDNISNAISDLLDDDTLKYLQPLTKLTVAAN